MIRRTIVSALTATALGTALSAAPLIAPSVASADVTLINTFEVPPEQLDTVIAAWRDARDFLAREPGYRSTALHRSLNPDAKHALINVAIWESPEAFARAAERMRAAGVFPKIDGVIASPALYSVIEKD